MVEIHIRSNILAHQGYMGAETTGSIFTNLVQNILGWDGLKVDQIKGPHSSSKGRY